MSGILPVLSMLLAAAAGSQPSYEETPFMKLRPFPLADVRLLEGRFKDEQERDRAYLLELEPDRLLHAFRANAGLPAPGTPYGGWEAPECEVRGHFAGHYLTACALMFAATGDEALKARAEAMVAELAKCQEALGGGYLSAFPASVFDRLEAGQPVWAPYYCIHKILAGLRDVHALCGNAQALDMAGRMAAYFGARMNALPPDKVAQVLRNEFGGMSEVLHDLYALTGKPEHLAWAHLFDQPEFLGPLALSYDNLTRIHGNTQIPKAIGAARHYEVTGDERYRSLTSYFWDRVVNTRTYATGGSTIFEHWPEPGKLLQTLGHLNHETCKTHNMLKLTRHLLEWTGNAAYGDYYERALLNGILGTQGPKPGQFQYYVAMAQGYPRVFGTPDTAFWCCYGTGIESFAKLGDSVYFHDDDSLYVNLFVASTVQWRDKGIALTQETRFPEGDSTRFTLQMNTPRRFALHVRVPSWIAGAPELRVNGQPETGVNAQPGGWMELIRDWKDGDRIEIRFPMALHTLALPDDADQVAVFYGPVVLSGILDARTGQDACADGYHERICAYQQSAAPVLFTGEVQKPSEWLARVGETPLRFRGSCQGRNIDFIPFPDVVAERYGLYWPVVKEGGPRHQALLAETARAARELDRVFPFPRDLAHSPCEKQHNLQGDKMSSGVVLGTAFCYRHAEPGGYFSWDLKVLPDRPAELLCLYWGSDNGRTFDIVVDGTCIATPVLTPVSPGNVVDEIYPIPTEVTAGKERVTVAFRASHETIAGGLFGCATLRP